MLTYLLITIAVLVILFVVVVAMRPSDFRTSRTATIAAPASAVFPHVNDFHKWEAWSPYDKRDPEIKRKYEGAPFGTGAVYSWSGNSQVGEGSSTIIESRPNDLIRIKLVFLKPFSGTSTAEFTFQPEGDRTVVTWSLAGKHSFMPKAMGLFIDMDKMIGGDFEVGLANLKSIVEGSSVK